MKVSVITSAYNRADDLVRCINSILKSSYTDYEIIVVDNASTDGTSEILKEKYGASIKLCTLTKNSFSTGGKNAGIDISVGDYLWFVDSDMLVSETLMGNLAGVLDSDPKIGLAGPMIYYYSDKNRVWSGGAKISLLTSMAKTVNKMSNCDLEEVPIILCGYMVRREVVQAVGGFDEELKFVFEESSFARKIHNLNYKIVLAKKLKIYHNVELPERITNPLRKYNLDDTNRAYFFARNRSFYMKRYAKWYGKILYFAFWTHLFCVYYIYKAISLERKDIAKAYFHGYVEGLKENPYESK
ncbi:MAG: glycosyltransferase family 2 protein [Roseburia sp.]